VLYMPDNIRVNADTKHLIAAAAIWKSPDLLRLLFMVGFVLLIVLPFCSYFMANSEKQNVKMREFQSLVQNCKKVTFDKYGYGLSPVQSGAVNQHCKRWANARVRIYENV
jgi:hypothetical protein